MKPYCQEAEFIWPHGWLLGQIDLCVALLLEREGKKPGWLGWKNFQILDRRRRSLRLVPRINSLLKRAIETREQRCGESVLEKAMRRPDSLETQILLRDFVEQEAKFVSVLNDHNLRIVERVESMPLLLWICTMDHPDAQKLILHGINPAIAGAVPWVLRREKIRRKRLKNRERQKRHRQRQNSLPEKRY